MKRIITIFFVLACFLCLSNAVFADGKIEITVDPYEAGTVTGAGNYSNNGDQPVTATPNAGYKFLGWYEEGKCISNLSSEKITTHKDRILTAKFAKIQHIISAKAEPSEGGSIIPENGTADFNTNIQFAATPNPGYVFKYWMSEGKVISSKATDLFTAYADREIIACFEKTPDGEAHTIAVTVKPDGAGTYSGAGSFIYNAENPTKRVIAAPNPGYVFSHWEENGTAISTNPSEIFDINRERNLVAVFKQEDALTPVDPGPAPVDPSLPGPPTPPGPYTEYTITYHPGAYGQGTPQAFTMAPGPGWLLGPTFTRPGYAQTGWSWYYDGKEKNADVFSVFAMPPRDIIVYPYWEPVKGPVTLSVGYSGSGAVQVNGRYVYNGEVFTLREGDSLTFGLYPSYGNYVYSVLLGNRYREVNTAYGYTITYDMLQGRNQTLLIRFESVYCRPKTGDDSNIALWAVLGACSVVCLGVLLVAKRKKK